MRVPRWSRWVIGVVCALVLCEAALSLGGAWYLHARYQQEFGSAQAGTGRTLTVIALGESSTGGMWVKPEESYPAQLQRLLQKQYPAERVRVIVPPHTGQNTSQMANRIDDYLALYHPDLLIIMAGINNQWSLSESHVDRYLGLSGISALRARAVIFLSNVRLYRLVRYIYLAYVTREESEYMRMLREQKYVLGAPELTRWPPASWITRLAAGHDDAFVAAWRDDMHTLIRSSEAAGARVLLMTYHLHDFYASPAEFVRMADEEHIPIVRNDLSFRPLVASGAIHDYVLQDSWHPSPLGYQRIARNAYDAIIRDRLLE
jgi:lysophospholipase L1-like esterase